MGPNWQILAQYVLENQVLSHGILLYRIINQQSRLLVGWK